LQDVYTPLYAELEISNDSENESTDNIGLPTYTSSPIQINQTVIIDRCACPQDFDFLQIFSK
jgi:hypothetical protein